MTNYNDDITRPDSKRLFPFPYIVLFIAVSLVSIGANNSVVALNDEGYCSYKISTNESYQAIVTRSESVRTTKDCGLFGWGSCTIYRQVFMTRMEVMYRIVYKTKLRCCEGWIEADVLPRLRPEIRCSKIPEPTTDPPVTRSVNVSDSFLVNRISTQELPVNYSIITTKHPNVANTAEKDTTDPGTLPGGPVSNPGPGGGGLFTGEDKTRNMIGLIGIVAGLILIILLIIIIAVCCCRKRRRKRERKLSDPSALELLNQGVTASPNGRIGESTYAEIPVGQTQSNQPDNTNPTNDNPADEAALETPKAGNQYHEITDLMRLENADLPPPPSMDSHLPVESNGYAYAYIDNKKLPKGDGGGNVELKANCPNAKYAEVHKNKKSQKSSRKEEEVIVTADGEIIPKTIQAYITHVPTLEPEDGSEQVSEQCKVDFSDNPEPYGDVEIGSRIPEGSEYDLVQMPVSKPEHIDADDGSSAYDVVGHVVGQTPSTSPEKAGYDKFQKQNTIDLCDDLPPNSGENALESNHYSSLEGRKHSNEMTEGSPERPPTYDRLDRQMSTTSMPHGSPTKSRKTLQKDSPHYSKLNRSTRQDASTTLPARHTGYGVVGDKGRHGTMPSEVYDRINTDTLSSQVPVQDIYDLGYSNSPNENGVSDNNSAEQVPEGHYATIPSDASPPNQTYDKLQRAENDVVNQNQVVDTNGVQGDGTGQEKNASSVYNTPDQSLNRQDTLYENTPKRKQQEARLTDRPSSATYDTPSSRNSLAQDDGKSSKVPANSTYDTPSRLSATHDDESTPTRVNSTYDSPSSRNSIGKQDTLYENAAKKKNADKDKPRNSVTNDNENPPARKNITYDSPPSRNSIELTTPEETLYENAAKTKRNTFNDTGLPIHYEHMEKGNRMSNASTGSYYEDMQKGNRSSRLGSRSSRASLDASVPSPFAPSNMIRQDTLYENTARDKKE